MLDSNVIGYFTCKECRRINELTVTMPQYCILVARACLRVHAYVEASRLVAHVCPEKQAHVKGKVEQDLNSYVTYSCHTLSKIWRFDICQMLKESGTGLPRFEPLYEAVYTLFGGGG
jgi:hypothetical protein